ncbi:MAG: DUF723 domain-containing protein [Bacteroidales bacterium]|nr:DUF723 domain-containing protein [Bacteroidales bacterium]
MTPLTITCPIHGRFEQIPAYHLDSVYGCPECGRTACNATNEEFIEKSKIIYGDKYDFSKVLYVNSTTKVIVICPEHGEFLATPQNFLKGHACPICGREKANRKISKTLEEFLEESDSVHGDRYDYTKTKYKNIKTPVTIICPKHGEFSIMPSSHLKGKGCPKCESLCPDYDTFIKLAIEKYKNKYLYDKVNFVDENKEVTIVCPEHGEFFVTPHKHLKGKHCPLCKRKNEKISENKFLQRIKIIHDNKYDYSRIKFKNLTEKVCIICPEHGEFWQSPETHLRGSKCPECAKIARAKKNTKTTEQFLEEATKIHGDKYDFSKVDYKGYDSKIIVICPTHGEFLTTPSEILAGYGCIKCGYERAASKTRGNTNKFIKEANEVHKNKYDYSKVEYKTSNTKVCIICPKHGEFWQTPGNHLQGVGCIKCRNEDTGNRRRSSTENFIKRANDIHGNKYDYSKVEYIRNNMPVCIICSKHGEFWQRPDLHLRGCGCPTCNQSSLETFVENLLIKNDIKYEKQKRFKWLGKMSLDFYLPEYGSAIECQGMHHFKPIYEKNYYNLTKEENFELTVKRDKKKNSLCKDNNVNLYYFSNLGIEYPYQVYENFEELINIIKQDNMVEFTVKKETIR